MRENILPLTSLRFFAAFFVMLSHLNFIEDNPKYSFIFVRDGFIGVTFFFILSGFILAYSYETKLKSKEISRINYFIARIARIYPLHFLTFILSLPLVFHGGLISTISSIPNLFLLHAWIPVKSIYFSANAPSWSISTELFFYLVFPFLILLKRSLLISLFLILISLQVISFSLNLNDNMEKAILYISPFCRVSDFILGIIIYRFRRLLSVVSERYLNLFQISSVLILVFFINLSKYYSINQIYKYSIFYILPMSLVIFAFSYNKGILCRIISIKFFLLLGKASFALYLIHQLIIRYISIINLKLKLFSDEISLFMIFSISLLSSIFIHNYLENRARIIMINTLSKKLQYLLKKT